MADAWAPPPSPTGRRRSCCPTLGVGSHRLAVTYQGDGEHTSSSTSVDVRVRKVPSRLTTRVKPRRVATGKRARLRFDVTTATGVPAVGTVVVKVLRGKQRLHTLRVSAVRGMVRLPAQTRGGTYRVKVRYRGSATVQRGATTTRYRVVR